MKKISFIYLLILLSYCTPKDNKVSAPQSPNDCLYYDTITVFDTVVTVLPQPKEAEQPNYNKKKLNEFYTLLEHQKVIDETFIDKMDRKYWGAIFNGILYDEDKMNDYILLFFLKLHLEYINKNHKYGYEFGCCIHEHISIAYFALQFCKFSHYHGTFLTYYIYEWVLTQPKYLEKEMIEKEVKAIKEVLSKKNFKYYEHLKLKEEMFYK